MVFLLVSYRSIALGARAWASLSIGDNIEVRTKISTKKSEGPEKLNFPKGTVPSIWGGFPYMSTIFADILASDQ